MSTAEASANQRIRTPDQRLRVFVSSTLQELAPERKAARRAIERLSAAPVMFELGARPHPPRSLYRAYLEQSDIFVGIYWEKYGWVAPGESVSGLEDEYNLAPTTMPKLIYVKASDAGRDPALVTLLGRIRADDTASYKPFTDARELGRLLVSDLAVLLAERFDDSRAPRADPPGEAEAIRAGAGGLGTRRDSLPAPLSRLLGREQDIARVTELLSSPDVRLVTLTGPGGVGKTRLAIEAARTVGRTRDEDVVFVPLAAVEDPALVVPAIGRALGIVDTGDAPLEQRLTLAFRGRPVLLVLDNFEQVLPAAPLVSNLLESVAWLKVIVTSRVLLRVDGEHGYSVPPLELPVATGASQNAERRLAPSVELFFERARSVKPDLDASEENVRAAESIVATLEGLPLAIELAASRTRLLTPPTLLERLDRQLPVLVGGRRDAPARQQTVRDTIEWSTRLLSPPQQELLWRLGVFAGRFSLEAVEAVAEQEPFEVLELLEGLVDASLVRQHEREGRTYFQLLATVREYALDRLQEHGDLLHVRARHAEFYQRWGTTTSMSLRDVRQKTARARLTAELDNLRLAERYLLDAHRWNEAAELIWAPWLLWVLTGTTGEALGWSAELLAAGDELPPFARAVALAYPNFRLFWEEATPAIIDSLHRSAQLFDELGRSFDMAWVSVHLTFACSLLVPPDEDGAWAALACADAGFSASGSPWGDCQRLSAEGLVLMVKQDIPSAVERFEASLAVAQELEDAISETLAYVFLGWCSVQTGDVEAAERLFDRVLSISLRIDDQVGIVWGLEGAFAATTLRDEGERCGLLLGAAEAARERIGMAPSVEDPNHRAMAERFLAGAQAEDFENARRRGYRLPVDEAIAVALDVLRSSNGR
ncbi:DUF4062 domain-containing protein [Naasia sp. SYSU D00948]|uniref:DUF4062 domain-containing protein n=1 Tax=Naasia sp. SYSU D00948 TaxID=2817379 RepID=UPI001B300EFD|nr:DUF4062 domain-containing protein [Naasia sp. SYSU D00948]